MNGLLNFSIDQPRASAAFSAPLMAPTQAGAEQVIRASFLSLAGVPATGSIFSGGCVSSYLATSALASATAADGSLSEDGSFPEPEGELLLGVEEEELDELPPQPAPTTAKTTAISRRANIGDRRKLKLLVRTIFPSSAISSKFLGKQSTSPVDRRYLSGFSCGAARAFRMVESRFRMVES